MSDVYWYGRHTINSCITLGIQGNRGSQTWPKCYDSWFQVVMTYDRKLSHAYHIILSQTIIHIPTNQHLQSSFIAHSPPRRRPPRHHLPSDISLIYKLRWRHGISVFKTFYHKGVSTLRPPGKTIVDV